MRNPQVDLNFTKYMSNEHGDYVSVCGLLRKTELYMIFHKFFLNKSFKLKNYIMKNQKKKNVRMCLRKQFQPVVAIISFPFLRLGTNGFFSIFCEAIFARSVRPSLEKFLAVEK